MQPTTFVRAEIARLEAAYWDDVAMLECRARLIVAQVCNARNWSFIGGMGTWCFYSAPGHPIYQDELPRGLKRLVQMLDTQLLSGHEIGLSLGTYRDGKWS